MQSPTSQVLIQFREPKAQTKNFAPRIGLAYSPGTSGRTSLRAGFGLSYDVLYDNIGTLAAPPQLQTTVDVSGSGQPNFLKNGGILPNARALERYPLQTRGPLRRLSFRIRRCRTPSSGTPGFNECLERTTLSRRGTWARAAFI